MPRKPKKPCKYPSCPELTEGNYCKTHQKEIDREYNRSNRPYKKLYNSSRWQGLWEVQPKDELALDRYEGYPSFYYKENIPVELETREIQEIDNPKFTPVTYKLVKRAGFLPITNELLKDSDQNIIAYVKRWIAKKHVVTKNSLIIEILKSLSSKDLKDIKAIKKVLNVDLDPALSLSSTIITNQDGFQWLDEQEDGNGRPLL